MSEQADADRMVERGAQGRADSLLARRADDPPPLDRLLLLRGAGGADAADGVVAGVDAVEQVVEVRDGQPIEPDIADRGGEVQPDVRLIAGLSVLGELAASGEPSGQPLPTVVCGFRSARRW